MAHKAAITALKKLTNTSMDELPPHDFASALSGESDRGTIILAATMLDDALKAELRKRMPSINSDEAARIFEYEGIAGAFSSRIKLAQAMGVIDRGMRSMIDLIREMRNAAAHARQVVTFATPEIRNAIIGMADAEVKDHLAGLAPAALRQMFCLLCGALSDQISGHLTKENYPAGMKYLQTILSSMGRGPLAFALPDKSPEASG